MKQWPALLFAALFAALMLAGCTTQTFDLRQNEQDRDAGRIVVDETQDFFVGGPGQERVLNAAAACSEVQRVVQVQMSRSLLDGVLSFITLGVYSPAHVRVRCR